MTAWTADRVLQLASDPAGAKAGQGLSSPAKWPSLGFDDAAVWGECQGSGSKPYQVQVDLSEPAFRCSCPSRKFPCKHGIGLMLMFAAGKLTAGPKPAWVEQWLSTRAEKQQKKQEKTETPAKAADEAAAAKRRQKRIDRIGEGLSALKLWAEDQIRAGLATVPARGTDFFDTQARRLVDAQCPGVARRVQSLASLAATQSDWHRQFLQELAAIHLATVAFDRRDQLPADTRDDLDAVLGIPLSADAVLSRPPVADRWQVVAQETTAEEGLRTRRSWLLGTKSKRPAVVLAFAHGTAALDASLTPGFGFDGELCFHPGNTVRAVVKTRNELSPLPSLAGVPTLDALCELLCNHRAARPWADEITVPVLTVVPVKTEVGWRLLDRDNRTLPVAVTEATGWKLAAFSGGHPVDVVVAAAGEVLRPLAAAVGGEFLSLTLAEVTA